MSDTSPFYERCSRCGKARLGCTRDANGCWVCKDCNEIRVNTLVESQAPPLYTIYITIGRRNTELRRQTDDLDRIWYLTSEWLKNPKTNRISVENPSGRTVFNWSKY